MKSKRNLEHWILYNHFIAIIWLLTAYSGGIAEISKGCPSICKCNISFINCSSSDLIELPNINFTGIENVQSLIINNTSIRKIKTRSFINYPELVILNITSSLIETIEPDAFCGLPRLANLSLEANRLQFITNGSFNCLTNLKSLKLDSNALIDIQSKALCTLQNLQYLFLDNNRIKTLSKDNFGCLSNLKYLRIRHNAISVIEPNSLCGLQSLTRLNLKGNRLKVIKNDSLDCLISLIGLFLEANAIEEIEPNSFRNLTKLRTLDLARNQLKTIGIWAFTGLSSVQLLDIEQNSITYIEPNSFCSLLSVSNLRLFQNKIQKIERYTFACLSNLKNLSLHNNDINSIESGSFCSMPNLWLLDLNENNLSKVSNGSFACLSKLTEVTMESNEILSIDDGAFKPIAGLNMLSLSKNKLSIIRSNYLIDLHNLETLDLSNNEIETIESNAFSGSNRLRKIFIAGNNLENLQRDSVSSLTNLIDFDLSQNKLHAIENNTFCDFKKLEVLSLDRNNLTTIYPETICAPNLRELHLDYNNIQLIASTSFQPLTAIKLINLDYNPILNLPPELFKSMVKTTILNITNGKLTSLDSYQFKGLKSLITLRLPFNNISKIDATAFKDLDKVAILDLAGNKLTDLSSESLQPLVRLQDLNINENELKNLAPNQFEYLSNLHNLRLQTNNIKHVDRKAFFGLNKLKLLQLSGNPIGNFREFNLPNTASMNFLGLSRSYPLKLDENRNRASNPVIIETLDLTNNFLSTIKNLDFGDCRTLNLSYNKLHQSNPLNFSALNYLAHLDLTGNRYSEIENVTYSFHMNNYSNIMSLNISSNNLNSIKTDALKPLSGLHSLFLGKNNLRKIDFIRPLSQLVALSVVNNRIEAIDSDDFKDLRSLKELYLGYNHIGTLPENVFKNTMLNSLYLHHNHISDHQNTFLGGLSNIRILNLNYNNIRNVGKIFKVKLPYLSQLYLSNNYITMLGNKLFSRYKNLRILDLSNNAITLSDQDNLGLTFLEKLNLARNNIKYLNCSGLPAILKSIILANNNIKKFDPNCDQLFYQVTKIDMSYTNLITNGINMQKDLLEKLKLINDLKLAGNNWAGIINGMPTMKNLKLDVSDNPIILNSFLRDLYDRVGPFLTGIQLNKCNILKIPRKAFYFDDLRIISLNHNNLSEFDMVDISVNDANVLMELSLANNNLTGFKVTKLVRFEKLKKLNISNNRIKIICGPNLDFAGQFLNIIEIDASGNKIDRIDKRCFKGLSSLQKLDLRMNSLAHISRESFFGPSKLEETLTNRPYFCCFIPAKITTCKPSMISDTLSSCQHLLAHVSLQTFVWVIGSLAFFGNIMVIARNQFLRQKTKKKVHIFLINNLALSDFIMSIYLFIIATANLIYSGQGQYGLQSENWLRSGLCVASCVFVTTSSIVSVFLMVIISIDRFIAIVYGIKGKKLSRYTAQMITGMAWLIGFAFAIVPALFSIDKPGPERLYTYNSMCMPSNYEHPLYRIWMISYITTTIIAWIITSSLYIGMFISAQNTRKAAGRSPTKENKSLAWRLSVILLTDLISWVPYYVVNSYAIFSSDGVDVVTLQFVGIFALPVNSALNPFLYTFTNAAVIKGLFIRPAARLGNSFRRSRNRVQSKPAIMKKKLMNLHDQQNQLFTRF